MAGSKRQVRRGGASNGGGASAVPTDAVFTIDELVICWRLPKSTIYKLAQEGEIPGIKVDRHWRFHRDTIDRWLTGRVDPDFAAAGTRPIGRRS